MNKYISYFRCKQILSHCAFYCRLEPSIERDPMSSFGNPRPSKFYRGSTKDTAWNNDLLWRNHIKRETNDLDAKAPAAQKTSYQKLTDALNSRKPKPRPTQLKRKIKDLKRLIEEMEKKEAYRRVKYEQFCEKLQREYEISKAKEIAEVKKQLSLLQEAD